MLLASLVTPGFLRLSHRSPIRLRRAVTFHTLPSRRWGLRETRFGEADLRVDGKNGIFSKNAAGAPADAFIVHAVAPVGGGIEVRAGKTHDDAKMCERTRILQKLQPRKRYATGSTEIKLARISWLGAANRLARQADIMAYSAVIVVSLWLVHQPCASLSRHPQFKIPIRIGGGPADA